MERQQLVAIAHARSAQVERQRLFDKRRERCLAVEALSQAPVRGRRIVGASPALFRKLCNKWSQFSDRT